MKRIAILGSGAWGCSLASVFGERFEKVILWSYLEAEADSINQRKESVYLPNVPLPNILATTSVEEVIKDSSIVVSVVPSFAIRKVWTNIKPYLSKDSMFINASKGIEKDTHLLPYQLFNEIYNTDANYYSMCGPSFATDVAHGKLTAVNLAGKDEEKARAIIKQLQTGTFHLRYCNDVIGTELGAVLKNVIAIASGMVLGMGHGSNTQAVIVVEGIREMMKLGKEMGAQKDTFLGLAGLGDLLLTAMNSESRNMSFGFELGKGMHIDTALKHQTGVAEGYYTAFSLEHLLKKHALKLPLFQMIVDVLIAKKPAQDCLKNLFKELF